MTYASHLMLRPRVDRVIATSEGGRRALADTLLRASRPFPLLVFRAADTHIHLLLACAPPAALECGRRIEIGLTQRLQLQPGFNRAHVQPVRDQRHLTNTFRYILKQEERHEVSLDPFHDASALPDLLGLRVIAPELLPRVREWLPRVDVPGLRSLLPAGSKALDERILAVSAAATFGLPRLGGYDARTVAARAAAVQVGRDLPTQRLAELLGVSPRSVRRLRQFNVPSLEARAVEAQVRMRSVASPPPSGALAEPPPSEWRTQEDEGEGLPAGWRSAALPSRLLSMPAAGMRW